MNQKQKTGVACIILAVLFALVAINQTFISPKIPVGESSGLGVSRMVGAFLPAVVALILGFHFLQKPRP